ncbi:hypothetical protein V8C40DRAFT_235639 [Trichoderma camerunense]
MEVSFAALLHNVPDEERREMTLNALVTAGSCGQMSVAGLPSYLPMDGYAEPNGARRTGSCLATTAAASWP